MGRVVRGLALLLAAACGDADGGGDATGRDGGRDAAASDGGGRDALVDAADAAGLDASGDAAGADAAAADGGGTDGGPVDPCGTAVSVAAGGRFTCAVRSDGSLFCFGNNERGQLGTGDMDRRLAPVRVGSESDWTAVDAGLLHACGTRRDGSLHCWGMNGSGQLGVADRMDRSVPTRVGAETGWGRPSTGAVDTCALHGSALRCFGESFGTSPVEALPGTSFVRAAAGMRYFCGVRTGGALLCWGFNGSSQLGLGDTMDRPAPTEVATGTGFEEIAPDAHHTCAVTTAGTLSCWGFNGVGELGVGDRDPRPAPTRVGTGTSYAAVAVGEHNSCALETDGTLLCWGGNMSGQLGLGVVDAWRLDPVVVGEGYASVTVSRQLHTFGGFLFHICAIRDDGALLCWGDNSEGQLGQGDTDPRPAPARVCFP